MSNKTVEQTTMNKLLTMALPDNSVWGVPVQKIAENRACHYASEFGGDLQRSLDEDTLPLFAESEFEISDWAVNNMNWSDFAGYQVKLRNAPALTQEQFQEAWMSADKFIEDSP